MELPPSDEQVSFGPAIEEKEVDEMFEQAWHSRAIEAGLNKSPCARDRCKMAVTALGQPTDFKGPAIACPHVGLSPLEAEKLNEWIAGEGHDLPAQYLYVVLITAIDHFRKMNNVETLDLEEDSVVDAVSGLNGEISAVQAAFKEGCCSIGRFTRHVVFLGDYIGQMSEPKSLETLLSVLLRMIAFPTRVHMVRGNHETLQMAQRSGFGTRVMGKYSVEAFCLFVELFDAMPLAYVVNGSVLLVHGGVPSLRHREIRRLNTIDRFSFTRAPSSELHDLMWAEPYEGPGIISNMLTGYRVLQGSDVVQDFLATNKLTQIVRAGHLEAQSHAMWFNRRVLSLSSYGAIDVKQAECQRAMARIGHKKGYDKLCVHPVHLHSPKTAA
eukprot:m51a1_g6745 hypothetical protein (383) ;mRNA; f:265537-266797